VTVKSALVRATVAALAGLAIALLAPAPAGAAGAWLAPVDLSAASGEPSSPQVAVDARGDAVAVWDGEVGTGFVVQAAVRRAGGAWQAPIDISAASPGPMDGPQVAIDAQGNAVAVWTRHNGTEYIVQSAVRPASGRWQVPVNLSAAGHNATRPQVALDPRGNAVAVWQRFKSRHVIAVQAATRPVGGSWQAPVELSASGQESSVAPQVAVGANGDAVAVWRNHSSSGFVVTAALRPAGGTWQAPVDISAVGLSAPASLVLGVSPQVAVDAEGNAVAVWNHPTASTSIVQGAVRTAAGPWQAPVNLSAAGRHAEDADIAVDPRGNAIAVWDRSVGDTSIVQSAARAAGGAWQAPVNLSTAGDDAVGPRVAVDPQGNAIAAWSVDRLSTPASIVQSAMRAAAGAWQAPVDIAAAGSDNPDVAVDAQGNAVAVWRGSARAKYLVEGYGGLVVQGADYAAATPSAVAASLTGLRLSPSAFRAGETVRVAPPRATQVSYTLNVAASVRFTVQRIRTGRKVAARCVKATSGNRRRKSCVRFVRVGGSFTRRRPAGADRFAFNGIGHVGGLLKPARYRLVATPIANGRTGTAAHALFRIVR